MIHDVDIKTLKPLVNNHDLWKTLDLYLEMWYNTTNPKIDNSSGEELYRLQGERRAISKLRKLRDQVNNAE